MPDTTTLLAFAGASLLLLLLPGPTLMYVVARGLHQGRGAALVSALGVEVGTLLQLLVAVGGLSALVASSGRAHLVLKYLGVAYLLWLGLTALWEQAGGEHGAARRPARLRVVFLQGVLVEALNPKTALFFVAFLPQFIDPAQWQFLTLGCIFLLMALCNDTLFGLLAGLLSARTNGHNCLDTLHRHATGGLYCSLAAFVW